MKKLVRKNEMSKNTIEAYGTTHTSMDHDGCICFCTQWWIFDNTVSNWTEAWSWCKMGI